MPEKLYLLCWHGQAGKLLLQAYKVLVDYPLLQLQQILTKDKTIEVNIYFFNMVRIEIVFFLPYLHIIETIIFDETFTMLLLLTACSERRCIGTASVQWQF